MSNTLRETQQARAVLAAEAELKHVPLDGAGAFAIDLATGTMAAGLGAAAEIFQFRWTHATKLCVVRDVSMWAGSIIGFAAGFFRFQLVPARAWSADGSGGNAATITGNNGKLRTSYGTTALGASRIASTAALTAGTKALDSQGVGSLGGSMTTTAGAALISPRASLLNINGYGGRPLVLAQNEGFAILATVPATGTWTAGVSVNWDEANSF